MFSVGDRVVIQTTDDYNEKFGFIKESGDNDNFRVHLDGTEHGSFSFVLFGAEELLKVKS